MNLLTSKDWCFLPHTVFWYLFYWKDSLHIKAIYLKMYKKIIYNISKVSFGIVFFKSLGILLIYFYSFPCSCFFFSLFLTLEIKLLDFYLYFCLYFVPWSWKSNKYFLRRPPPAFFCHLRWLQCSSLFVGCLWLMLFSSPGLSSWFPVWHNDQADISTQLYYFFDIFWWIQTNSLCDCSIFCSAPC